MAFYILLSAGLVTYAFSNLHLMKAGFKALNEDEARTLKRRELEFMMQLDKGGGVTQAEFILAILEQQGVIDPRKDIAPWREVWWCNDLFLYSLFVALLSGNYDVAIAEIRAAGRHAHRQGVSTGTQLRSLCVLTLPVLTLSVVASLQELEVFHRQEAVLATSHLEEINRDRSASITAGMPVLSAAERILRSPWTSMDDGPVTSRGGRTASGQLSSSPNSMMNESLMPMLPEGHY
jgi:hypothetical protein